MTWWVYALLAALAAALTALLTKIGLRGLESDFAAFLRTAMILLLLALWVQATGKWQPLAQVTRAQWLFLGGSAVAAALSWLFYFKALQIGQVANVAAVDKLSVVLVALFGVLLLGERLAWQEWLGVGLISSGALLLVIGKVG